MLFRSATSFGSPALDTTKSAIFFFALREKPSKNFRISGSSRLSNSARTADIDLRTVPDPIGMKRLISAGSPQSAKNGLTDSLNSRSAS